MVLLEFVIIWNWKQQCSLQGLSIVNGCQSLNTVLSCSERRWKISMKLLSYLGFMKFHKRERADRISISTNSQSAVKPRDLRSNDKRLWSSRNCLSKNILHGYFISKRGEKAPAEKDKTFVLDLSDLGKYLISWHSQRPNISYSETKIFDKYFEQLFRREYSPENAQILCINGWIKIQSMDIW